MRHNLVDFTARGLLSLGLCFCIYLAMCRTVAEWHFAQNTEAGLRTAIEWGPDNPTYYASLSAMLDNSTSRQDFHEILRLREKAITLNPHWWEYWIALADAYERSLRTEEAKHAYKQAQRLFPRSPQVNWQLGNFYLRQQETDAALAVLRTVLLTDESLRQATYELVWRAIEDPPLILRELLPMDVGILLDYLNYLSRKKNVEESLAVWAQIRKLGETFEPAEAFSFLDALIDTERVDKLTAAWEDLAELNPTRFRRSSFENNLIQNGNFEGEIMNGGLGWRVRPAVGVVVRVSSTAFFDGTHSLSIQFDGSRNVSYHHTFQYVPVSPNTLYRFMGYMRVRGITTNSGPRFQIADAYDSSRLSVSTDNLVGSTSWTLRQLEFQTGPETHLLILRLRRPRSQKFDSKISGTVWIDRLSVTVAE